MKTTPDEAIRAAAQGVSTHAIMQLLARALSFVFKAVTIRALGPKRFAFTEIHLGVLLALATLPARAGFRKMAVRADTSEAAVVLAGLGSVVTGVSGILGGFLVWIWSQYQNGLVIAVMVLGIIFEGLGEVDLVIAIRYQRYRDIAKVRAVSVVAGSLFASGTVLMLPDQWTVVASTGGELVQRICLVLGMNLLFERSCGGWGLLKAVASQKERNISREEIRAACTSAGQAFWGFVLANGESFVLETSWNNPSDKGNYKLAGNIASLIARCFSEALEEQSFNVFSIFGPSLRRSDCKQRSQNDITTQDDEEVKQARWKCRDFWTLASKSAFTVSLLICTVGPAFTKGLIHLLYGAQYESAVGFMNAYFVYLVFMSINGIAEAFLSALATSSDLLRQSCFSVVFSFFYLGLAYLLTATYGPNGLIAANCFNMAVRIIYAMAFYSRKMNESSITSLFEAFPKVSVLGALLIGSVLTRASENIFLGNYSWDRWWLLVRLSAHALSGVLALGITGAAIYIFEKDYVKRLKSLARRKPTVKTA